jgi:hypothetical protein
MVVTQSSTVPWGNKIRKLFVTSLLKEGKLDLSKAVTGDPPAEDIGVFDENIPNVRKGYLASSLAELSISSLARQYTWLHPNTPTLTKSITSHLEKTISMCKEIAYSIEQRNQNEKAIKENRDYLFKWEEIPGRDEVHFLDYLKSKFDLPYQKIKFVKDKYNKILTFRTRIGPLDIDVVNGNIEIDLEDKSATLCFENDLKNKINFKVRRNENGTYLFTRAQEIKQNM